MISHRGGSLGGLPYMRSRCSIGDQSPSAYVAKLTAMGVTRYCFRCLEAIVSFADLAGMLGCCLYLKTCQSTQWVLCALRIRRLLIRGGIVHASINARCLTIFGFRIRLAMEFMRCSRIISEKIRAKSMNVSRELGPMRRYKAHRLLYKQDQSNAIPRRPGL
ncbi:hypothetical protein SISSUDRAFT_665824 [Sistotremastrum suecicum HHB10207 ss-3]|uniref:Uncharacterized protein n=1 Tax=Sistotremastrum suecicum HHB10207 ss-3 TaxID=1314776 RepID=A0A166E3K6_9AGAM|nr:hypothetical protein SISSUDRAFT_665824 [Sistotremastrum suecicum HHB10207 ss-3]